MKSLSKTTKMNNEFYIHALKTKSPKDIEYIYREHLNLVTKMICKAGGNEADARDIFQEALIIIFRKVQQDELTLTCQFRTYICSICQNLWFKSIRYKDRMVKGETLPKMIVEDNTEELTLAGQRKKLLFSKLNLLNKDEQKVLRLFFEGTSMKEIARIMGYGSVSYAKKKKCLCKNKLVALMKGDRMFSELVY